MGNRGILSSLGAGLSLVIAGVIALAVVSGIVAFRGWPELREDTATAAIALAGRPGGVADPAPQPVVLGGGKARVVLRARAVSSSDSRRARRAVVRPGRPRLPRARSGGPERPAPSAVEAPAPAGPAVPVSSRRRAPAAITQAAQDAGRVADQVARHPTDVPAAVDGTTQVVHDVIGGTSAAADAVAGSVLAKR
jgi:hypothetical protein